MKKRSLILINRILFVCFDCTRRRTAYRQSLQFYAPTVAAQQVLFIGVKQFSAQKITRYSFVLWHNGAPFSRVRGVTVAFVTLVFINHHNFTGVGYSTVLVTYSLPSSALAFRRQWVIRINKIFASGQRDSSLKCFFI